VLCRLVGSCDSKTSDPMATVVLAEPAVANLEKLITTHSLPPTTRARVRASLEPLAAFPLIGSELVGRWSGFRFILGPWPWMLLIYEYDRAKDEVGVVSIQDSRSARAATSQRRRSGAVSMTTDEIMALTRGDE
jgi:plasmid stabilization system protein ParE